MKTPAIVLDDPYLSPYKGVILKRMERFREKKGFLENRNGCCRAHYFYGEHLDIDKIIIREWAPNAEKMYLLCDRSGWQQSEDFRFSRLNEYGDWEIAVDSSIFGHGDYYRILVIWNGGSGERIPAYSRRVVQDPNTYIYSAQLWFPEQKYYWKNELKIDRNEPPIIYEAHIGMAQEEGRTGTYAEFRKNILPRIIECGYNTVQFMALMEHPYYASFGYQVSSFFAVSSKYGTPEEFKELVDKCHESGLRVIMDLIHSHAVKNEVEGITRQDGTDYLYFHQGAKGEHPAWDSRCFDYGKNETLNFLLSNCVFWLEEYNLDGFRFDGVTSMIYHDHGLGVSFDHYDKYFNANVDEDAVLYLSLANDVIHSIKPASITIAEDMSGLPGIAAPIEDGGCGFDYRLAMGIPDFWIKIIKEKKDEDWKVSEIWNVLNNRRYSEKHIAYSECHDQAIVGDKTILFRLMDAAMYTDMTVGCNSLAADRGISLVKIINLLTLSTGGSGYMTFMGNEFGHPEWIDFPREGNGWSHHYARRQWHLADDKNLRYSKLLAYTRDMINLCSNILINKYSQLIHMHDSDGVISYRRGNLQFVINLNGHKSYTDYGIAAEEGEWELVLNSDSPVYDGHGRLPDSFRIKAIPDANEDSRMSLYVPTRTALVFRKLGVTD